MSRYDSAVALCSFAVMFAALSPAQAQAPTAVGKTGDFAVVSGGLENEASGERAAVGGGRMNRAAGIASVVAGGYTNVAGGEYSSVGGGWNNTADGYVSTVGGGWQNAASGQVSTVSGGQNNQASAPASVVGGGFGNQATGAGAVVPGGRSNIARGDYSFAAGRGAQALHTGSFVWADAAEAPFASTRENQFLVRASGNVGIDVADPAEKLTVAGAVAPGKDASFSLGSSALRWTSVYLVGSIEYADTFTLRSGDKDRVSVDREGNMRVSGTVDAAGFTVKGQPLAAGSPAAGEGVAVAAGSWQVSLNDAPALRLAADRESVSLVAGHAENRITEASSGAVIGGGGREGQPNVADGGYATIAGGMGNQASGPYTVIGGGFGNQVFESGTTVAGGIGNVASNWNVTVSGGRENNASGLGATIGGGRGNIASNRYSVVPGGYFNAATGAGGAVGGGFANLASGFIGTVPGGSQNEAAGEYSFAAGRRAKALHNGAFVWADSADADFASTAPDQLLIRASGGVGIGVAETPEKLTVAGNIAPSQAGAHDLGSAALPWRQLYLQSGIAFSEGLTLRAGDAEVFSIDREGNLVVKGRIQAGSFAGDGSQLTGLAAPTVEPGTGPSPDQTPIDPSRVVGIAVTMQTPVDGALSGTLDALALKDQAVQARHLAEGSVGLPALDLGALDSRYATSEGVQQIVSGALSNVSQTPVAAAPAELADGSVGLSKLDVGALDARYAAQDRVANLEQTTKALQETVAAAPAELADGSVGFNKLDVGALDARYAAQDRVANLEQTTKALQDAGVDTTRLADGSIGLSKLDTGALDARYVGQDRVVQLEQTTKSLQETLAAAPAELADGSVGFNKLDVGALDARYAAQDRVANLEQTTKSLQETVAAAPAELAEGSVGLSKLDTGALDARYAAQDRVANLEQTTKALQDAGVDTTRLADGSIGLSKLDTGALDARYVGQDRVVQLEQTTKSLQETLAAAPAELAEGSVGLSKLDVGALDARYAAQERVAEVEQATKALRETGVDATRLADGSIGLSKLDTASLDARYAAQERVVNLEQTTKALQDAGVDAARIADGSIGLSKLDTAALDERFASAERLQQSEDQSRSALDRVDALEKKAVVTAEFPLEGDFKGTLAAPALKDRAINSRHLAKGSVGLSALDLPALDRRYATMEQLQQIVTGSLTNITIQPGDIGPEAIPEASLDLSKLDLPSLDSRYATLDRLEAAQKQWQQTTERVANVEKAAEAKSQAPVDVARIPKGSLGLDKLDAAALDARYATQDRVAEVERVAQTLQEAPVDPARLPDGGIGLAKLDAAALDARYAAAGRMEGAEKRVQETLARVSEVEKTAQQLKEAGTAQLPDGSIGLAKLDSAALDARYAAQERVAELERSTKALQEAGVDAARIPEGSIELGKLSVGSIDSRYATVERLAQVEKTAQQLKEAGTAQLPDGSIGLAKLDSAALDARYAAQERVAELERSTKALQEAGVDAARIPEGSIELSKLSVGSIDSRYATVERVAQVEKTAQELKEAGTAQLPDGSIGLAKLDTGALDARYATVERVAASEGQWNNVTAQVEQAKQAAWPRDEKVGGALEGTLGALSLAKDTVTSAEIRDGSIGLADVDLGAFDARFKMASSEGPQLPPAFSETLRFGKKGRLGIGTDAAEERLTVAGNVKAERFLGDGSGLTNLPTPLPADGSLTDRHFADAAAIAPAKVAGIALTQETKFQGAVEGTFESLALKPGAVGRDHLAERSVDATRIAAGGVTLENLDLPALDARYEPRGEKPAGAAPLEGPLKVSSGVLQVGERDLVVADGRVGVGTATPRTTLDVEGTVRIAGGNPGPGKVLTSDADGVARWEPMPAGAAVSGGGPNEVQYGNVFGPLTEQPLVLQAGSRRTLRVEPNPISPNLIGGQESNAAGVGVLGATVGGGGALGEGNRVEANFGTVGGGAANEVRGEYGTVSGGMENEALGARSTIGGGRVNKASGIASAVSGGFTNLASGNYAYIGAGWGNLASGYVATVPGGWGNQATGLVSTVSGGQENRAWGSASVVGGGWKNQALGLGATVPGGKENIAAGDYSVALGFRAEAAHAGAFVWNGNAEQVLQSTAAGQYLIGAPGNVGINTATPTEALTVQGNVLASGQVRAGSFVGDGSALQGIVASRIGAGTVGDAEIRGDAGVDPAKIRGVALTRGDSFAGAVQGRFDGLQLAPGAVQGEHVADGVIGMRHLDESLKAMMEKPAPSLDLTRDLAVGGAVTAASFAGDGSALTRLPAGQLVGLAVKDADVSADAAIHPDKIAGGALTRESRLEGDVVGTPGALKLGEGVVGSSNLSEGAVGLRELSAEVRSALDKAAAPLQLQDLSVPGVVTAGLFEGSGAGLSGIPFAAVELPEGGLPGTLLAPGAVGLRELSDEVRSALDKAAAPLQLQDLSVPGVVTASRFAGSGAGLTGIPLAAVQMPEGSIAGDRIAPGTITAKQLAPDIKLSGSSSSEDVWQVGGNPSEKDQPMILGTLGASPLYLYASGQPVLRLYSVGGTANLLAGYSGNRIPDYASGAVVAGGGEAEGPNVAGHNFATVSGGSRNVAENEFATVGGGLGNSARGFDATISGGQDNLATGSGSTIGGGFTNLASGSFSTLAGGAGNQALGNVSAVLGGFGNVARGTHSSVPGGSLNEAAGDYSLAAGRRAKAAHAGSFVWADSHDADVASTGADQWVVRAAGGVYLYSDADLRAGVKLDPGSGSWSMLSDAAAKENRAPVDSLRVLEALRGLPINEWRYRTEASGTRHIGPSAQDFYAAFELGREDTYINYADAHGVALAAIQGLHQVLEEKTAQLAELEERNLAQARQIERLEQQMRELQQYLQRP